MRTGAVCALLACGLVASCGGSDEVSPSSLAGSVREQVDRGYERAGSDARSTGGECAERAERGWDCRIQGEEGRELVFRVRVDDEGCWVARRETAQVEIRQRLGNLRGCVS